MSKIKIIQKRLFLIISYLVFILILFVLCLKNLYSNDKDFLEFLVDTFIFIAAACAAIANWKMMVSNKDMVAASRAEIEILTSYHDYAISPIIIFEFIDGKYCLNNLLIIKNVTDNTALKVTVFAKLSGKEYISGNTNLIVKNSESAILMHDCSSIIAKFMEIYERNFATYENFKDIFLEFFNNKDNRFFVVYVDIEGKIHGTTLLCGYYIIHINKAQIFPPNPEDFEKNRRDIPYYPIEQQFYILNDAITQGIGIALIPPKK